MLCIKKTAIITNVIFTILILLLRFHQMGGDQKNTVDAGTQRRRTMWNLKKQQQQQQQEVIRTTCVAAGSLPRKDPNRIPQPGCKHREETQARQEIKKKRGEMFGGV